MTTEAELGCAACGMRAAGTYHPYTACLIYRQSRSADVTRANIAAVVDYGMKAAKAGVTLEQALNDFTAVIGRPSKT